MRIGLLRHFPVAQPFPRGWRTAAELEDWLRRYDQAEVTVGAFDLAGVAWRACHSSDLPRARVTAARVFSGDVVHTELLREAQYVAFPTGRLRLPVPVWHGLVRFCWMTGHSSQRACRDEFVARVRSVADRLSEASEDTLVVSHAGLMAYLSAELRRRGFTGPKLRLAKHAQAYVYHSGG